MGRWLCEQKGLGSNASAKTLAMRTANFALPREKGRGRCDGFCGMAAKVTRRPVRLRMAGDGDRLQRAKGSEPAIKPERPEAKDWLAKVGFRKENGRAVRVLGGGDGGWMLGCVRAVELPRKNQSLF